METRKLNLGELFDVPTGAWKPSSYPHLHASASNNSRFIELLTHINRLQRTHGNVPRVSLVALTELAANGLVALEGGEEELFTGIMKRTHDLLQAHPNATHIDITSMIDLTFPLVPETPYPNIDLELLKGPGVKTILIDSYPTRHDFIIGGNHPMNLGEAVEESRSATKAILTKEWMAPAGNRKKKKGRKPKHMRYGPNGAVSGPMQSLLGRANPTPVLEQSLQDSVTRTFAAMEPQALEMQAELAERWITDAHGCFPTTMEGVHRMLEKLDSVNLDPVEEKLARIMLTQAMQGRVDPLLTRVQSALIDYRR